mmetsp:Transcript_10644/g.29938  ORF Transcript_10644/g.29938 Transcript_10644/m.29938 type:complete len:275 (+) Transcript_10644:286-1110(+)
MPAREAILGVWIKVSERIDHTVVVDNSVKPLDCGRGMFDIGGSCGDFLSGLIIPLDTGNLTHKFHQCFQTDAIGLPCHSLLLLVFIKVCAAAEVVVIQGFLLGAFGLSQKDQPLAIADCHTHSVLIKGCPGLGVLGGDRHSFLGGQCRIDEGPLVCHLKLPFGHVGGGHSTSNLFENSIDINSPILPVNIVPLVSDVEIPSKDDVLALPPLPFHGPAQCIQKLHLVGQWIAPAGWYVDIEQHEAAMIGYDAPPLIIQLIGSQGTTVGTLDETNL